ncbi:MAG: hypothetical protein NTX50_15980 [Candidatus Sumerlaeota bacterium]|nr:hypothetical protein [Candidatus Sumerlaeota bacterium]
MSSNEHHRQKKLMKQRQKVKARKQALARAAELAAPFESLSLLKKILQARSYPIYECLISTDWRKQGIADIILAREQPDGKITFGAYLVDFKCLGLKSCFCNADFTKDEYRERLRDRHEKELGIEKCPLELAHHLIYGGIDYAAQFGFKPVEDFEVAQFVLEEKGKFPPCPDVSFGQDGKPFYIAGPRDNVDYIMRVLKQKVGEGNFNFLVPVL